MAPQTFASASGLRPMSAFVVIAAVILTVAFWVVSLIGGRAAAQPNLVSLEEGQRPSYSIADASGQTLATFVPRFDLVMSPRSMWQAHTPRRMARKLAEVLDDEPTANELVELMLPDARNGVIEVDAWDLSVRQAHRLEQWIENGIGVGVGRLPGIWTVGRQSEDARGMRYRLVWQPSVLLAESTRAAHGYDSAWTWARCIADGIEACLRLPVTDEPRSADERKERRSHVWAALIPKSYCRPVRGIPAERVLEVRDLLRSEGVAPWQMKLAYGRDRVYPAGEHELFGDWGFALAEQKEALPRSGFELLCDRMLAEETWSFLEYEPALYAWQQDRTVRGQRANGFLAYEGPSQPPVVRSTLDLRLQSAVRRELEEVMKLHEPALAMAIVLDVQSGDVLALESVEHYEIQPFAPVYYTFTPGSSFKILTMAIALEEDKVQPTTEFDAGHGHYSLVDPKDGRTRIIREAEGALTGWHTAAEMLAFSVNAGLVQIGLRVPADTFRSYLVALGYGKNPGAGLGIEKAGHLRELPWKYRFTHASVSFGHEVSTTVWQHAAALATVVRGGVWRPLRLISGVEQNGTYTELSPVAGKRVFSERTCNELREMMRLGAFEGTGRDVRRDEIDMGTKTGTAEKVPTELCVHVELSERERWKREGIGWTKARYNGLKTLPKPHRSCYTSSMCTFGRLPGSDREIMVFVVVDEPRGKEKFGSKVAGPAAVAILSEALGLTRGGEMPVEEVLAGFGPTEITARNELEQPWREGRK